MAGGRIERDGQRERSKGNQIQKPAVGWTAGVSHEVDSKPAPFGEPKPKGCATQEPLIALRVLHPPLVNQNPKGCATMKLLTVLRVLHPPFHFDECFRSPS